jgi:hypothetical protein
VNIAAGALGITMSLVVAHTGLRLRHSALQGGDTHPASTFVGQIMDSKCAIVGSHDPTMKNLGAKDERDCTMRCAKDGSFVLYNAESKTVYQLNDQEKPVRFAGQRVKISGSYDKTAQTIVIESIEAAAPDSQKTRFNRIAYIFTE